MSCGERRCLLFAALAALASGCSAAPATTVEIPVGPVAAPLPPPVASARPPLAVVTPSRAGLPPLAPFAASPAAKGADELHVALETEARRLANAGDAYDEAPVIALLGTGDAIDVPFVLQPGRCYSFIFAFADGVADVVADLDAHGSPAAAGGRTMTLAKASLGPSNKAFYAGFDCFKNPTPVPISAVLRARVRVGAGRVAAVILAR